MIFKVNDQYQDQIFDLYQAVGWINYTRYPDLMKKAWESSLYTVCAYQDQRLIGFVRVVGDGVSIIYIQDLIVHPDYQRQGIGTLLVSEVLKTYREVYQIVLTTDDTSENNAFYQHLGFMEISFMKCKTMMYNKTAG